MRKVIILIVMLLMSICFTFSETFANQETKNKIIEVEQTFNYAEGIGIRVIKYTLSREEDLLSIDGKVELDNNSKTDIVGIPLYRVYAKDSDGKVHTMLRSEDREEFNWTPYKIPSGSSEINRFDGDIKTHLEIIEFSVGWDGKSALITKWIKI